MAINNNNYSEKLIETFDQKFHDKISTEEGYQNVVDSFSKIEEDVVPEFKEQLRIYKEGLLSLCSDHVGVVNDPEVQSTIAQSHKEFMLAFGKTGNSDRSRKFRGILLDSTSDDYGNKMTG